MFFLRNTENDEEFKNNLNKNIENNISSKNFEKIVAGFLISSSIMLNVQANEKHLDFLENYNNSYINNEECIIEVPATDSRAIQKFQNENLLNNTQTFSLNRGENSNIERIIRENSKKEYVKLKEDIKNSKDKNILLIIDFGKEHAGVVTAIGETVLKDSINTSVFYSNQFKKASAGVSNYDAINEIAKENKNKSIYVNLSSSFYINSNLDKLETLSSFKKGPLHEGIEKTNNKLIKILNENPNLHVSKAAGNSLRFKSNNLLNNQLKSILDSVTNGDFQTTKDIVQILNDLLLAKLEKNINPKWCEERIIEIEKTLRPMFESKKANYDSFISLYIKDFNNGYERLDMLNKSKDLKYNNLNIVEAIDHTKLIQNYRDYKKYNNMISIPELDTLNKSFSMKRSYTREETELLQKYYNKYKDTIPEIYKYTTYGSISHLVAKENNPAHNVNIHKQMISKDTFNSVNGSIIQAAGTSFSVIYDISKNILKNSKNNLSLVDLANNNKYANQKIVDGDIQNDLLTMYSF